MKAKKVLITGNKELIGKDFSKRFEDHPFIEKDFVND
jgi:hypothetical protein